MSRTLHGVHPEQWQVSVPISLS